ncbi:aminoglycoside 6-adenylyltransferase [Pullulanibacillus pueri]|uniref:Aminoglycoside 6-adenylyltransferase n=1 Tax=Pullulanibacillus pueri TaxID=1437324 RepID=A0A8J2ZYZ7_9BACL|nr:aminoglycoside 6-adenylyltransferase [Pullulanibacillus pueri]MBM7683343.1 aminoglycoside 6-adenylyltransferase [Pullulanibacillus pueri]GGH86656.1 aminoglycoside 6-adenylyltransferase [Pullulanibacillus pueri]
MRSESEMMKMAIDFARHDDRIRLVTLEGSRTNKNIPRDAFQDYDISYFVTEMDTFKENDKWLDFFGKRLIMQKPEDMELFPPDLGNWFSYLMLFEDGNRIDLTLIPINEVNDYFSNSDGLVELLLDKDSLIKEDIIPSDRKYWIQKPTARAFDDCCNEFWWVATYVVKGLARREILFAMDHLHEIVRPNVLRMMSWQIGLEKGFNFSVGKNYKFINHHLPKEDWEVLLSTYSQEDYSKMWLALFTCYELFRKYSKAVAKDLGYRYPDYDEAITEYTTNIYKSLNG